MSIGSRPLLNYLGSQNPSLDITNSTTGTNTRAGRTPWANPQLIKTWDDFEYDALTTIYGGALREVLECQFSIEHTTVPHIPFCQIHSEKSFETLVSKWNQTVVSKALDVSHENLRNRLPLEKIYMCSGDQAQLPSPKRRPDWAGIIPQTPPIALSRTKSKNILPGDTKVSKKWSSAKIKAGVVAESMTKVDWIQPVGQIYTYCIQANARYGYIITDEELVAFRIRPSAGGDRNSRFPEDSDPMDLNLDNADLEAMQMTDGTPAERAVMDGILEYKAVPWSDHFNEPDADLGILTVNLALWWLHIMASENSCIEEVYPALKETVWTPRRMTHQLDHTPSDETKTRPPLAKKMHNRRAQTATMVESSGIKKRQLKANRDIGRLRKAGSPLMRQIESD